MRKLLLAGDIGGTKTILAIYAVGLVRNGQHEAAYSRLRRRLGQVILLGLEVLIIGDIVRTIIVDPTVESVAVLGLIVVIRIVLSFSLEVEMDGAWPWNRWKLDPENERPAT